VRLKRSFNIAVCGTIALLTMLPAAHAGIPRGVILIADEQDADASTGITIARGNAELTVEKRAIHGSADVIELNPVRNAIQFSGHANLTVGRAHYDSDAVTCTLDFDKCTTAAAEPQAVPVPPAASAGAEAMINPR
jgi:hypothetical protein